MSATSNVKAQVHTSNTMKNKGNIVSQKENDNFPATKHKCTEYCDPNDNKSFKIAVIMKF